MAGVSVGFAKCFMLFMAIVILVQGVVYLGLALWGITLRDCQATSDIVNEPFKFAMDLIYFVRKDCGDPTLQLQDNTYQLTMDWPKSYEVTHREYAFMITYAVVSGLWVASSVLIIFTICCATTKLISGIIYWPWFLSVLAGCSLDVVATVFHAIDITKTLSLEDTFRYVGATTDASMPSAVWTYLETFGVYFSTPAILLTCISSRVVLIWLLNLIGGIFCLSLSNVLANQTAEKASSNQANNNQTNMRQQTPLPEPVQQQPTAPAAITPQSEFQPQLEEQIRPRPLPIIIPVQSPEPVQPPSDRTALQSPVFVLPPPQQQQQQQQQQQSPIQSQIYSYVNTDAHPDQLNYPAAEPNTPRPMSPAAQQLSAGSTLNSRYSEIYPIQPSNPRVTEELRNQMPWSYTSMITKQPPPPPPRKPQLQVQIYPQIPEPDYAEH